MDQAISRVKIFVIAFLSSSLLFVGFGTVAMLIAPVIYDRLVNSNDLYRPLLPLAEARSDKFLDVDDMPIALPYPSLPALSPVWKTAPVNTVGWIRIPAIGLAVPIALSPTLEDSDVLATLIYGAALYPNGVAPGHLGNTFISAHSTGEPWKGKYRFAFLRINELESGHELHLDMPTARYTYRVVAKELVKPSADFRVESGRPKPTLTLMACWPRWTSNQRLLITGELTNITQLTERPQ